MQKAAVSGLGRAGSFIFSEAIAILEDNYTYAKEKNTGIVHRVFSACAPSMGDN